MTSKLVFSYDEFFAAPIEFGRYWWTAEGETLLLQAGQRRGDHILLHMSHEQGNWAQPGPINGWDGNLEKPTLSPSILVEGVWHGFLENGEMRTA